MGGDLHGLRGPACLVEGTCMGLVEGTCMPPTPSRSCNSIVPPATFRKGLRHACPVSIYTLLYSLNVRLSVNIRPAVSIHTSGCQ